jgi:uncharacterized Fe-S cluster-containing radical SAM superfamily protein
MKHYLMNPTWRCQSNCPECWVRQAFWWDPAIMGAVEAPFWAWRDAIAADTPDIMDVAGGEPLLVPWVIDLIHLFPQVKWGLSTNGLLTRRIDELAEAKLRNIVSINVSFHPNITRWLHTYKALYLRTLRVLLNAGYSVHTSVVDYGDNVQVAREMVEHECKEIGLPFYISPYEDMNLDWNDPQGMLCQGGINHLVMDPAGDMWPCLSTLRSPYRHQRKMGNWLEKSPVISRCNEQPCHVYCIDYHILAKQHPAGDMWNVQARPMPEDGRP